MLADAKPAISAATEGKFEGPDRFSTSVWIHRQYSVALSIPLAVRLDRQRGVL